MQACAWSYRRYLLCPALLSIGHLQKFVSQKLELDPAAFEASFQVVRMLSVVVIRDLLSAWIGTPRLSFSHAAAVGMVTVQEIRWLRRNSAEEVLANALKNRWIS